VRSASPGPNARADADAAHRAHRYVHSYADSHRHCRAYGNCNSHRYCYSDAHADVRPYGHANANCNFYRYADSYADSSPYGYANANLDSYLYPHPDAYPATERAYLCACWFRKLG